ncbi:ecto-NOX disulfide-thiol exchanger 1 isoform X2 [Acipenser oxyrinchus oxyrinchus]|uniref:Ecto-NOX disulfide-thiol exchanger 1 isoform X2 n=1 Tax=Acipenser oxyrinchus oxyrinchus TaxID=40147 RepID=A0AAD8DE21_ACIOX|nr:ecto-NOX disulfide-thiol exchanger 1 isoform X2 [Acipenser oxyrinchus oxyrinchus]
MVRVSRFTDSNPEVEGATQELSVQQWVPVCNSNTGRKHSDESSGKQNQESYSPAMAGAADGFRSEAADTAHISMSVADPTAWATAMNNLGIVPMGLTGQHLLSDSVCLPGFDPGLGIMTGITPINPMMAGISLVPPPPVPLELPIIKEIIHCKSCTLFPQNPNLPPPSTRERPPGCKTVFVGGLPENATEEIIREVFDQCGEITAIRKSKKNFCHIRFTEEFMVDKAIYLSGYRMRIGSSTDKKDSGRLHVDFAQARDDFYEWECMQRLLAREERHRRKIEEERLRPPSPPPIMHFSEHEAGLLAEKLKDDIKFTEAIAVLVTWIDRGEVNRRSANHFYSMVQSANSHVRRLMNEKAIHEEEMELAKERFRDSLSGILTQFEQIVAVFAAATRQRAWDHFSKAQRKNIDIWRKQCEELRNAHSEELMGIRGEEEMEMSEDESEENPNKKIKIHDSALAAQAYALKEENDSLRWQLDVYRNEVELLRQEQGKVCRTEEDHTKEHQLHFLQQTMQGMQQQLVELQGDLQRKESELEHAREEQRCMEVQLISLKEKGINGCSGQVLHRDKEKNAEKHVQGPLKSEKEALLLGIISTFLHVHPFGANIEYLWSYIQRLDAKVSASEIETLMLRLPHMFKQEFTGVGATLEKRWIFCGFEGINTV